MGIKLLKMLTTLMKQFLKLSVVAGKLVKDQLNDNDQDQVNHFSLLQMDFGYELKIQMTTG